MKNYFITMDMGDGIPNYDFVIKAKSLKEAENMAYKVIKADYPDYTQAHEQFSCHEISANDLLERLTIIKRTI